MCLGRATCRFDLGIYSQYNDVPSEGMRIHTALCEIVVGANNIVTVLIVDLLVFGVGSLRTN